MGKSTFDAKATSTITKNLKLNGTKTSKEKNTRKITLKARRVAEGNLQTYTKNVYEKSGRRLKVVKGE